MVLESGNGKKCDVGALRVQSVVIGEGIRRVLDEEVKGTRTMRAGTAYKTSTSSSGRERGGVPPLCVTILAGTSYMATKQTSSVFPILSTPQHGIHHHIVPWQGRRFSRLC